MLWEEHSMWWEWVLEDLEEEETWFEEPEA